MSEEKDVTQPLTRALDSKRGWEKLIATPEWSQLMTVLQEQTDSFQRHILFVPLRKLDDALEIEYMKGQLEGRLSLTNTIETIIEGLEIEINSLRKPENGK